MPESPIPCPRCNKQIRVPGELLGHWIQCPGCGFSFAALGDEESPEPEKVDFPGESRDEKGNTKLMVLVGGIFLSGPLCLVLILGVHLAGDKPAATQTAEADRAQANQPIPAPPRRERIVPREEPKAPAEPRQPRDVTPLLEKSDDKPRLADLEPPLPPDSERTPLVKPEPAPDSDPKDQPAAKGSEDPKPDPLIKPARGGTGKPKKNPFNDLETGVLKTTNEYRKAAHLQPLELDRALCDGCAAHGRYLIENQTKLDLSVHEEDPKAAGYSKEGEQAAKASVIIGGAGPLPGSGSITTIDIWMGSLYHRIPLLRPNLKRIGYSYTVSLDRVRWFVMIDTRSGVDGKVKIAGPVVYPAKDQKAVPRVFSMGFQEVPNPIPANGQSATTGYPITVTFFNEETIQEVDAKLTCKVGNKSPEEIPFWLSSPAKPAGDAGAQQNTICLIPQTVLRPNTQHTVTVTAKVNGQPWKQSWGFTTGVR